MKVMRHLNRFAAGSAIVAVAAFASVGIAQADGMPSKGRAVVYEKPADWSGFYFGVHSGWQWSEFDGSFPDSGTGFSVSQDSSVVGGQIGLQHQFGNFVLGVEGSLTVAFQDGYSTTDCPNAAFTCGARFEDLLTVGPRLGWAMGKWMPYITGGYANGAFTQKSVLKANNLVFNEGEERHSGWFIGGGVDMAFSHGWTVGLDYRHYDFDDIAYSRHNRFGNLSGDQLFGEPTADIVTLRASWKLGRPAPAPLK